MVLAVAVVVMVGGCGTAAAWVPVEPDAFERLAVERTVSRGSVRELRFGAFAADSVDISWARGSGDAVRLGRLGLDDSGQRQNYRFSLRVAGGGRVAVTCTAGKQEGNVSFGSIEIETAARAALDCDLHPGTRPSARLALSGSAHVLDGSLRGDSLRMSVRPNTTGNRVTGVRARSYDLVGERGTIATVDVRERVVWLARRARDEEREVAAGAAAALLLRPE